MEFTSTNIIQNSALFQGLTKEEFEGIYEIVAPCVNDYQKNEIIITQGERVQQIGIIEEGKIIGTKLHYDGSSQILSLLKVGGILGLESVSSSFSTSPCMLIADTYCSVAFFTYQELFTSPDIHDHSKNKIWQNVINILADENIKMMYKIDTLSKRTLRERIITYLSIIMEKKGQDTFDIGMNQDQFSQYLCVNRSVLSKELNSMKREGLIYYHKSIYTINKNLHRQQANP